MKCSLLGVLRRQGKERAVEVRTDPSGEFLGCLVRQVHRHTKEAAGDLLPFSQSADSKLELFQVRSEAALQKLVRKRTRKERRKRRKEGEEEEEVRGHVWTVGVCIQLIFAVCVGGGDSDVYRRGRATTGAHSDLQS